MKYDSVSAAEGLVFKSYAGSLQVDLSSFEDLLQAIEMPETLWIALACPTEGLACDAAFLGWLDADHNGRIRVSELRAAVREVAATLTHFSGCDAMSDVLSLKHLKPEATLLESSARFLLTLLQAADSDTLSLDQIRQAEAILKDAAVLGDGILVPRRLSEPALRTLAEHLLQALPPERNAAGEAGVSLALLARARDARAEAEALEQVRETTLVWGEASLEVTQLVLEVRTRLDEFFLLCRLVSSQPDALGHLQLDEARLTQLVGDRAALERAVAALPVAVPVSEGVLRADLLHRGPLFERLTLLFARLPSLLSALSEGLEPEGLLTEATWVRLRDAAASVQAWQDARARNPLVARAPTLLGCELAAFDELEALCREDLERRPMLEAIRTLERLALYQRWLLTFANNFISMPDLYSPDKRALFECGTLYLAGREFLLTILVPDHAAHVKLAAGNPLCLAYVKVTQRKHDAVQGIEAAKSTDATQIAPFEVAVPVTSGVSSGIDVGRRGLFVRYDGLEFDAEVLEVIRHPVSLWEALSTPMVRIRQFLAERLTTYSSSGQKALEISLEESMKKASTTLRPTEAGAEAAHTLPSLGPLGLLIGGGVTLAALGSSLALMLSELKKLTLLDLATATLSVLLLVSVPSGVVGYFKLRRRNLALMLEGSGWALNDQLLVTRQLGALLTRRPARPANARISPVDEVKHLLRLRRLRGLDMAPDAGWRWWQLGLVLLVILGWIFREPVLEHLRRMLVWP